jgi:hypothetical protein
MHVTSPAKSAAKGTLARGTLPFWHNSRSDIPGIIRLAVSVGVDSHVRADFFEMGARDAWGLLPGMSSSNGV